MVFPNGQLSDQKLEFEFCVHYYCWAHTVYSKKFGENSTFFVLMKFDINCTCASVRKYDETAHIPYF